MFEQLVIAAWNLRRIQRLEHDLAQQSNADPLANDALAARLEKTTLALINRIDKSLSGAPKK